MSAVVGKGRLLLGLCAAVGLFLVVSACGAAEPGPRAGPTPVPGEGAAGEATGGVEDSGRPKAPILSGLTLDGEPISTEDFLGTPFVVKVFAEH